jgi:hypothetical protein
LGGYKRNKLQNQVTGKVPLTNYKPTHSSFNLVSCGIAKIKIYTCKKIKAQGLFKLSTTVKTVAFYLLLQVHGETDIGYRR